MLDILIYMENKSTDILNENTKGKRAYFMFRVMYIMARLEKEKNKKNALTVRKLYKSSPFLHFLFINASCSINRFFAYFLFCCLLSSVICYSITSAFSSIWTRGCLDLGSCWAYEVTYIVKLWISLFDKSIWHGSWLPPGLNPFNWHQWLTF